MYMPGFGHMTQQLMTLSDRKVALVLEGGYEVEPLCDCAEACLRALLNEKVFSCCFHVSCNT
jgi:acetoin utilization deacetylase AcuC-like enzyme